MRTKVRLLRQSLVQLDDADLLPRERERLVTRIRSLLTGPLADRPLRPRRPSVLEEVEVGLYFAATLWEVAPDHLRGARPGAGEDLSRGRVPPPSLPRLRILDRRRPGRQPVRERRGDRATLLRMRAAAVDAHLAQCRLLFDELTTSERQVAVSAELRQAVEQRACGYPRGRSRSWSPFRRTRPTADS